MVLRHMARRRRFEALLPGCEGRRYLNAEIDFEVKYGGSVMETGS
jgi:hypothetical protein